MILAIVMAMRAYIQLDINIMATHTQAPINDSDLQENNLLECVNSRAI